MICIVVFVTKEENNFFFQKAENMLRSCCFFILTFMCTVSFHYYYLCLYTQHILHACPSWRCDLSSIALSKVSSFFLPLAKLRVSHAIETVKPFEANLWYWAVWMKQIWLDCHKGKFIIILVRVRVRMPNISSRTTSQSKMCRHEILKCYG